MPVWPGGSSRYEFRLLIGRRVTEGHGSTVIFCLFCLRRERYVRNMLVNMTAQTLTLPYICDDGSQCMPIPPRSLVETRSQTKITGKKDAVSSSSISRVSLFHHILYHRSAIEIYGSTLSFKNRSFFPRIYNKSEQITDHHRYELNVLHHSEISCCQTHERMRKASCACMLSWIRCHRKVYSA